MKVHIPMRKIPVPIRKTVLRIGRLACVAFLLVSMAVPSYALCVCDMPNRGTCCRPGASPESEKIIEVLESSCCAKKSETEAPTSGGDTSQAGGSRGGTSDDRAHHDGTASPAAGTRLTAPGCERQVLQTSMNDFVFPAQNCFSVLTQAYAPAHSTPALEASRMLRAGVEHLARPPGAHHPNSLLLKVSFLV